MKKNKPLGIKSAIYLGDKKYSITFNTGEIKIFDLNFLFKSDTRYANSQIFAPLNEEKTLEQYKVTHSLSWNAGAIDIAPETLYAFSR